MNAEFLAMAAGVLLSLVFSYVPKVAPWFAAQDATTKRGIMLGLMVLVGALTWGAGCFQIQIPGVTIPVCSQQGVIELLTMILLAAIANQTAYQLSPEPEWKKAMRAAAGQA